MDKNLLLNTSRLQQILAESQLDGIIATRPENIVYATGFAGRGGFVHQETMMAAVITPTGGTFILPRTYAAFCCDVCPSIDDIRLYGDFNFAVVAHPRGDQPLIELLESAPHYPTFWDGLHDVLTHHDLARPSARIGIDEGRVPIADLGRLTAQTRGQFVPASSLWRKIRMIKTPAEIDLLRRSATISSDALTTVLAGITDGTITSETDIVRAYHIAVVDSGALPGSWHISGGYRAAALRPPVERQFATGDIIRFDLGATYKFYWSDFGRTASLGPPSDHDQRRYNALVAGYQRALSLLKPGAIVSDVFSAAINAVRDQGIHDYQRQHCGHGIGLEIYDEPIMSPQSSVVIEPGMVLCIELPYYELGSTGYQIEDIVLVTDDEPEILTTVDQSLINLMC